jgi:REP element-mobilizing transposase RayT
MAVCKPITNKGIYFVTYTCYRWLPLIEKTNCYDIIYRSFDVWKKKGHAILGYVIMPNHLHLLLHYSGGQRSLNVEIGEAKRFIAYEIVKRLMVAGEKNLLNQLQSAVQPKDRSRGKKHEVWESSFDCKECRTEKFVFQKLQYIHHNPCSGKWKLVRCPLDYPYSSISFYISGKQGIYPVTDYRQYLMKQYEEMESEIQQPTSPSPARQPGLE